MRLPHVSDLSGVDAGVVGIPTDDAVGFRSGARFGPEGVRSASVLLRSHSPEMDVDLVERLSIADLGDAPTVPGYHVETLARVYEFLVPIHAAGVAVLGIGGDHSCTLAELRAAAQVHGRLGLVHVDAHPDVIDNYFGMLYFHGTVFRRAIEEGLVDPARSVQLGLRGTVHAPSDAEASEELGLETIWWEELRTLTPASVAERVRGRVGAGPVFLSFDIDFVDPAFAPGTGTPEPGGPTSSEALAVLRGLQGLDYVAADCVEVSPPYDPSGITTILAANVCHTLLCLIASGPTRRSANQPPASAVPLSPP